MNITKLPKCIINYIIETYIFKIKTIISFSVTCKKFYKNHKVSEKIKLTYLKYVHMVDELNKFSSHKIYKIINRISLYKDNDRTLYFILDKDIIYKYKQNNLIKYIPKYSIIFGF